jgi:hypothetical protein
MSAPTAAQPDRLDAPEIVATHDDGVVNAAPRAILIAVGASRPDVLRTPIERALWVAEEELGFDLGGPDGETKAPEAGCVHVEAPVWVNST